MEQEPRTLMEAIGYFADPDVARKHWLELRWPNGMTCPTCGGTDVWYIPTSRKWECKEHHDHKRFSAKVGTIFEDSNIPLDKLLVEIWMIANCERGVGCREMGRALGIAQKSAWQMTSRVRLAMRLGDIDDIELPKKLTGWADDVVEPGSIERFRRLARRLFAVDYDDFRRSLNKTKRKSSQSEVVEWSPIESRDEQGTVDVFRPDPAGDNFRPMIDPISDLIALLRLRTEFDGVMVCAGHWAVRYSDFNHPSFCIVAEGTCWLRVDGQEPARVNAGDFLLIPATVSFTISGVEPAGPEFVERGRSPVLTGEVRRGTRYGKPDVRLLSGMFIFEFADLRLLALLFPSVTHLSGNEHLSKVIALTSEEIAKQEPGRDFVMIRLLELLLVGAFRSAQDRDSPPGLARGLTDHRIGPALRRMHACPAAPLADSINEAAMSDSGFYDRFNRIMGVKPMEYLFSLRMALAKNLLQRGGISYSQIAKQTGYGSKEALSTAFKRHFGRPPRSFANSVRERT